MIDADTDWYIRHRISEALEGVASAVRAKADHRSLYSERHVIHFVADAIDEHVSKMRGTLQRQADAEAREIEDAAQ